MKALSEKLVARFMRVVSDDSLQKCRGEEGVDDSLTKQHKRKKLKQVTLLYFTVMMAAHFQDNKTVFDCLKNIKKIPESHEYFEDFNLCDQHLVRLSDDNMNNPVALDNICYHLRDFLNQDIFSETVEIDKGAKDLLKRLVTSCDGNTAEVNGLEELYRKLNNIENSSVSENNRSNGDGVDGSNQKRPGLFKDQDHGHGKRRRLCNKQGAASRYN
jgi:hypothetical protein